MSQESSLEPDRPPWFIWDKTHAMQQAVVRVTSHQAFNISFQKNIAPISISKNFINSLGNLSSTRFLCNKDRRYQFHVTRPINPEYSTALANLEALRAGKTPPFTSDEIRISLKSSPKQPRVIHVFFKIFMISPKSLFVTVKRAIAYMAEKSQDRELSLTDIVTA